MWVRFIMLTGRWAGALICALLACPCAAGWGREGRAPVSALPAAGVSAHSPLRLRGGDDAADGRDSGKNLESQCPRLSSYDNYTRALNFQKFFQAGFGCPLLPSRARADRRRRRTGLPRVSCRVLTVRVKYARVARCWCESSTRKTPAVMTQPTRLSLSLSLSLSL